MTSRTALAGAIVLGAAIQVCAAMPARARLTALTLAPTDRPSSQQPPAASIGAARAIHIVAGEKESATAPAHAAESRAPGETDRLFIYFEEIQKLTAQERLQEYDLLKRTFAQEKSDFVRVQMAILLSVPDSTFHDEERAQSMLDPLLKDRASPSALRPIAYLISIMLEERKKLEEDRRDLEQLLDDEKRRNDALEQKLEALRLLEKNLIEREGGNSSANPSRPR